MKYSILASTFLTLATVLACSDEEPSTDAATDAATAGDARADAAPDSDAEPESDAQTGVDATADAGLSSDSGVPAAASVPRAVRVARTTVVPACTVYVDPANAGTPEGTAASPYTTLLDAMNAAAGGAIICAAEGTYSDALLPELKYFTLAGGFQSGASFAVRDSMLYPSKAVGDGTNTFLRIENEGPRDDHLTAVDGFEISGYSQAIVRDIYYTQRFDITNNYIHDNICNGDGVGGGFSLNNVSGTISGNVIARNICGRGGAGALFDSTNMNTVSVTHNWIDGNAGDAVDSHGGGLYLFANTLTITANEFTENRVSAWGGGLYVGTEPGAGLETTATLSWNVYRDNRAEVFGGGFFCDDSATCISDHELYEGNCGGNIFLDSGPEELVPTVATFDHLTNFAALEVGCAGPGAGVIINKENTALDMYSFTNSIFWGNATDRDFAVSCMPGNCNATIAVTYTLVQTEYLMDGLTVTFSAGNIPSADPRFVEALGGDFHLASTNGHWTPAGYVPDAADSPALAAGDPGSPNNGAPDRAGARTELGAYGNSVEASYVQ